MSERSCEGMGRHVALLTDHEVTTMLNFVRLKSIRKVAEQEHLTQSGVKHRLSCIYEKLRSDGRIGDGMPCMELVEYVLTWKVEEI